jgi:hypothetical protein
MFTVFALSQVYFHYQRCHESLIRTLSQCNAREAINDATDFVEENRYMYYDAGSVNQKALRLTMPE